jgi:hypothetical protein
MEDPMIPTIIVIGAALIAACYLTVILVQYNRIRPRLLTKKHCAFYLMEGYTLDIPIREGQSCEITVSTNNHDALIITSKGEKIAPINTYDYGQTIKFVSYHATDIFEPIKWMCVHKNTLITIQASNSLLIRRTKTPPPPEDACFAV